MQQGGSADWGSADKDVVAEFLSPHPPSIAHANPTKVF